MRENGSYSVFDHTADLGLDVKASSLEGLFETAAEALFDIMFERVLGGGGERIDLDVVVAAAGQDELLVRWLSELLFLYDTKGMVFDAFRISTISERNLEAVVTGREYDPSAHSLKTEIKAITYHDLSIRRSRESWHARLVIDV